MSSGTPESPSRRILHVDMDAFYASVEQRDDPNLCGKPVLVGFDGPRGVVAAASYEARAFGCSSAQPMSIAKRHCPNAVIVPVNMARYHEASDQVFSIFAKHTDLIEPLSIDEAFLDVSRICPSIDDATELARRIKTEIKDATRLNASIGVATNKFLAKLASDLEKPDGLTTMRPEQVLEVLGPLPIERIPGIGPAVAKKLHAIGVRSIAEIREVDVRVMKSKLGRLGGAVADRAWGRDDRPVTTDRASRSVSCEETFQTDVADRAELRRELALMSERLGRRVRKAGLQGRRITLKIRCGEFETSTRSRTMPTPVDRTDLIHEAAEELLDSWLQHDGRPIRLLGVGVSRFETDAQLDLFAQEAGDKQRRVDRVTDELVSRFGREALRRGASLRAPEIARDEDQE